MALYQMCIIIITGWWNRDGFVDTLIRGQKLDYCQLPETISDQIHVQTNNYKPNLIC